MREGYIAHVRKSNADIQSLETHLVGTAGLCSFFTATIRMPLCGHLLGLLHDLGKYSAAFQKYIRNITGLNGEAARAVANKRDRGTIDHAAAGAQYIWSAYEAERIPCYVAQILSVVIMSHHSRSGMKDFIDLNGTSPFLTRLHRGESRSHTQETLKNAAPHIIEEVEALLNSPGLIEEFHSAFTHIQSTTKDPTPRYASYALLARHLFSCLLDADRLDTSNFENPKSAEFRTTGQRPDWRALVEKLETYISAEFTQESKVDQLRALISDECRRAAQKRDNLFTLQVPTGGGKTIASLRFALHRAAHPSSHRVDRIIYILPYTSILDQNAAKAREILGDYAVLEHHSNLSEEKDTWRNRVLSENWDAPVVFTTSVQFLNALFAAGTKTARRMHQLSNSVLIFDEIQSLPIKTVHLFNNAINYLCGQGNTTAVLCTATMPLLQSVDYKRGALPLNPEAGIIQNRAARFAGLKRTTIVNDCRPQKWSNIEIADLAFSLQAEHRSVLIVCNTKPSARGLFDLLQEKSRASIVHLSTNMCSAHRKQKIEQIRTSLDSENSQPLICVSTQLIEAGVDLDFGCVIRALTGLDSIVQAAGRCNRHGLRETGFVHVLNFKEEHLGSSLGGIKLAQEITLTRIFEEFKHTPELFDHDLLSEKALDRFYKYYFHQRKAEMVYPCEAGSGNPPLAQSCSILSLLTHNNESQPGAKRIQNRDALRLPLKHAFSTAAQAFEVIDAPTQGIVVPYDKDGHFGSKIIGDLAASYTNDDITLADQVRLHKQAQHYTVNAFPNVISQLHREGALYEIKSGEGIFYLRDEHYHDDLGVTLEALSKQPLAYI
jgi:CRISPR-associated endonuclease/helicase Cas3